MGLLKDFVTRGIYYNSIGLTDYMVWMKNMLDYCGSEIRPYMKDIRKWSIVIQNSLDISKAVKLNCWQFMGCRVQKKDGLFHKICGPYICPVFLEKNSMEYMGESTEAGHAGLCLVQHVMAQFRELTKKNIKPVWRVIFTDLLQKRRTI